MALKAMFLVFSLLGAASSMKLNGASNFSSEAPITMLTDVSNANSLETIASMEKIFARSQETHHQALDRISKSMTEVKAVEVLEKSAFSKNHPKLKQITGLLSNRQNLRKHFQEHDGFGGLNGARLLLNDMIFEVMVKYDQEIMRCTAYYAQQCALMEVARGQISAANFVAATARALILDSQANINHCEISIPETKAELKDHNHKCKTELGKLDEKLKIILNDIAVMTMILEMSDCDAKFLQYKKLAMLKCRDECSQKEFVSFNHKGLQQQVDKLASPRAQTLMNNFADMFDEDEDESPLEFVQVGASEYMEIDTAQDATTTAPPPPKKTKFNNPPVPKTKVPSNPCVDPNKGAPPTTSKRGSKCTLKKSPRCYKLQARFLQIQAEIADARDELMDEIQKLKDSCEETKKTLESSINNDGTLLSSSQTKMGTAMEKEASAGETGRQVAKENQGYNDDLVKTMKTCSTNYQDMENEMCALKKIRGDLFKKMKPGHPGFFQDCEVSPWAPETCTKKCGGGGEQKLTRSVLTHPNGGTKCLPLSAEKKCGLSPCPVNCVLSEWGGWSKCSAKCGGGMKNRVRDVKTPMQYGGKQCGPTTEGAQCNVEACSKDCDLLPWTKWTACSKHCDGGSEKRERFILNPAEGSGKCSGKWSPERLEYKPCNAHRCLVPDPKKVMKCNKSFDIVMLIDQTPKGGKKGFASEIAGAAKFVDAFEGKGITAKPNFALIAYTGPRTWSGVSKCTGMSTKKVDMEKVCKIRLVSHYTDDLKKFKSKLEGLEFQPGSKLLSLGLMTVESELALGNKNYRTVVIVYVDGNPLSFRKVLLASRKLRKQVRLVWVVAKKFSPLADVKKWASRRWQENIVVVNAAKKFEKAETGTHIVADICPRAFPKLESEEIEDGGELPPLDF